MNAQTRISPIGKTLGWVATGVGVFLVAHAVIKALTRFNFYNKVVLITGGSRGLGLIMARHLAEKGAKIAICARSADDLELARQELEAMGAEVIAMTVDITANEEVKALIRDVVKHYGRLDVLINNAGIIQVGPQNLMGIEEYQVAMQTNFWAQLYAIQASLPHFLQRGEGKIVNITSLGGKIALPHLLPYSASKFAALGLSEGMHAELKKYNIHVTTVVPNLMRTGSPVHADIKGDHGKEYAWFKHADSNPMFSQDPDTAAATILKAVEYGESEAILSLTGKFATLIQGFAPTWVNTLMSLANKYLPDGITGGNQTLKGAEAESALSQGPIARLSDKQAARNNEN
ncbi:MAG: SDR family NAD(P)-dependent oxidoreductase [Cyclobacteriaceae bacterium]